MSTPDVSKDFNETHMGRFDQILVVDGSTDLKATYDNAKHIITNPGPVHSVVILNAFPNLYDKFLENLEKKAPQFNNNYEEHELIKAYNETINPTLEDLSLEKSFGKTGLRAWQHKAVAGLHVDSNLYAPDHPYTLSVNVLGQGTGIDTRSTKHSLQYTHRSKKNSYRWGTSPNIDIKDASHCLYAPTSSICILREEGPNAQKDTPPSPHISGDGKRFTAIHFGR